MVVDYTFVSRCVDVTTVKKTNCKMEAKDNMTERPCSQYRPVPSDLSNKHRYVELLKGNLDLAVTECASKCNNNEACVQKCGQGACQTCISSSVSLDSRDAR